MDVKANEFLKKVGIEAVKSYIVAYEDHLTDELKRLVEAHEIIKLFKSLDHAKAEAQACEHSKHSEILVKLDVGVGYIWLSRVKQAIIDVESCQ